MSNDHKVVKYSKEWLGEPRHNHQSAKDRRGVLIPFKLKVSHDLVRVRWDGSRTNNSYHKSFIEIIETDQP